MICKTCPHITAIQEGTIDLVKMDGVPITEHPCHSDSKKLCQGMVRMLENQDEKLSSGSLVYITLETK